LSAIRQVAEDRIYSLACALDGPDRPAFIAAASAAVAELGRVAGEGSIHRTIAPIFRRHFHPPTQTDPIEPRRPRAEDDEPRRDRRRGRTMATVPKRITWRGVKYPSRSALAETLAPYCGDREPSAIACMLAKLNDNGESAIQHYQGKPKPKTKT
jgi:hypothetical protein